MTEQLSQPEPTLEAQKVLLDQVNSENAQRLVEAGLVEKAQNAYQEEVRDVGHSMLAYAAPEASDDVIHRHAELGTAEVERAINPDSYTVNHQLSSDMTEHYGITYDKRRNILVGSTEVNPEDGSIHIVPAEGFTEADVEIVRGMTQELEKLKSDGKLPDLTDNLQWIYKPNPQEKTETGTNSEPEPTESEELRKQQAERDKQEETVISNFSARGATEEQVQNYRQDIARMKQAELKRGRLFPNQSGFVRFEALSKPDDDFDMGVETGLEQGGSVRVERTSGQIENGWIFMGINKGTGLAVVGRFDDKSDDRLYKDYPIEELIRLNKNS